MTAILSSEEDILEVPVRFLPPDGSDAEWPEVSRWGAREWAHWLREHNRYHFLKQWTEEAIEKYIHVDRYYYGLGFATAPNQTNEQKKWFYLPTPVAVPFHASKKPNILFGGAAGGSKSFSLRYDGYRHCFAIPRFNGILMRRTLPELERNHLSDLRREVIRFNDFFEKEIVHYHEKRHEVSFSCHGRGEDAMITFGHCQNLGDEEAYLGPAYDGFWPDEGASFEKTQIVGVAARLRSEKRNILPQMKMGTNPGGAKTLWLKDYFIDKLEAKIRADENPKYRASAYDFVPAVLYDNPYYMDPDGTYTSYEERLFAYDPERRKQMLLGDWDALSGQFFPEFNKKHHVMDLYIPEGCKIERWIDWGYSPHYGICYWVACLPNGRLYVFYEYKFNGQYAKNLLVASEVASKIRAYTVDEVLPLVKGKRISRSIGDPSMWGKDGHSGEDYAETFRKNGVHLIQADNERVLGWGRLRHWLRDAPDGYPWIMCHSRCETAIRTIPALVRDEGDPDDCDTTGEDHPADAWRYGVMARPTPTTFSFDSPIIIEGSMAELLRSELSKNQVRQVGMVS